MENRFKNEVYRDRELSVPDRGQMSAIASCAIIIFETVVFDTRGLIT